MNGSYRRAGGVRPDDAHRRSLLPGHCHGDGRALCRFHRSVARFPDEHIPWVSGILSWPCSAPVLLSILSYGGHENEPREQFPP